MKAFFNIIYDRCVYLEPIKDVLWYNSFLIFYLLIFSILNRIPKWYPNIPWETSKKIGKTAIVLITLFMIAITLVMQRVFHDVYIYHDYFDEKYAIYRLILTMLTGLILVISFLILAIGRVWKDLYRGWGRDASSGGKAASSTGGMGKEEDTHEDENNGTKNNTTKRNGSTQDR